MNRCTNIKAFIQVYIEKTYFNLLIVLRSSQISILLAGLTDTLQSVIMLNKNKASPCIMSLPGVGSSVYARLTNSWSIWDTLFVRRTTPKSKSFFSHSPFEMSYHINERHNETLDYRMNCGSLKWLSAVISVLDYSYEGLSVIRIMNHVNYTD